MTKANEKKFLKKLQSELKEVRNNFSNELKKILAFKIVSDSFLEGMGFLFEIMDENENFVSKMSEEQQERYNNFLEEHSFYFTELMNLDVFYLDILNEKVIVDQFSAFEELLFKYYYILFKYLPGFLVKSEFENLESSFESLFYKDDIEIIRHQIISKKIKSNLQSENITSAISKFEKRFKYNFKITEEENKEMFKFSQIRNIIVHNSSKVNSIFLSQMKIRGIKHDFKEDELIHERLDKLTNHYITFLEDISRKIEDVILKDVTRIYKYYTSMYELKK